MAINYVYQCALPPEITLGHYILHRLRQLGIHTIFGLPGEFNMPLLDKIYTIPQMVWAGNTNELNAAYAADGYSRIKRLGCLVTTFGVGELSAINGVAGSFAEHVGLIHIVGMPPISAQVRQLLLHHTLGNGDFKVFYRLASDVAAYTSILNDMETLASEVDKCLTIAFTKQRPVYLGIPVNMVDVILSSSLLNFPLNLDIQNRNVEVEEEFVAAVLSAMYKSQNPAIIVDACVTRHGLIEETKQLVERTPFPVFCTPMGKGALDEQHPHFGGTFVGSMSSPQVREVVDFSDFILVVGALLSDFNTSSFHFAYRAKNTVLLFSNHAKLKNAVYPDLELKVALNLILARLDSSKIRYRPQKISDVIKPKLRLMNNVPLRQEWVWSQITNWFRAGDIVITETGTSAFGINQSKFPSRTRCISQALWGSVGYSVGACLGASFAAREEGSDPRVILFVGDGALQLTVQEVSTMIRWGLKPIIFLMNNNGYTIDRLLHKKSNAGYHDIQSWDNLRILPTFGASHYDARKVKTVGDFLALIEDPKFAINDKIKMVEVLLPPMDAPPALMEKWLLTDKADSEIDGRVDDLHAEDNDAFITKRIKLNDNRRSIVDYNMSYDNMDSV
ncbi:LANO_0E11650g1_1 [Lachancea nothofagi CBS 11611]|uniref:LANO_0E11650g1_1 n=1 Tax=Lachancea nothofagi CBS 11611 TaxID=1266666 RepID=A0A1G4JXK6_9SACH|nr:LANO_0E11650g1_1 [Lachancea nothofagi CBS 11611]